MPPVDLAEYRACVDLVARRLDAPGAGDPVSRTVEKVAADPVLRAVLDHHPRGAGHVLDAIDTELRGRTGNGRAAASAADLLRVHLLHQIDILWWGGEPAYPTSAAVTTAADLVDLEPLRARRRLAFRYRRQTTALPVRVLRAVERRVLPGSAPGAGLRYPRARPEIVAFLNGVAGELTRDHGCAPGTVWLNSAVRSQAHQDHLRALGYSALTPSSHCSGYAADITVRRPARAGDTDRVGDLLTRVLLRRQDEEEVNVIGTGPVWHLCLSPTALPGLRARFDADAALRDGGN